MTDSSERRTPGLRAVFGANLGEHLAERHIRQDAVAKAVTESGLGEWDQGSVSRFIGGKRALTLDEAVILAAVLRVSLTRLLVGEGSVMIGHATVPVAQVRDIIETGHIGLANASDTALDRLNGLGAVTTAESVADELGITIETLDDVALTLWSLDFESELERRMNESYRAFTGRNPPAPVRDIPSGSWADLDPSIRWADLDPSIRWVDIIPAERRRGWMGMHLRHMKEDVKAQI